MELSKASQLLNAVPTRSGVYLMKDVAGNVLYVGKGANLRSRLRSYFGSNKNRSVSTHMKLSEMMPRVEDFEYIVTDSEAEALLLENNLIKRHQPRFNVRLKDDKNYPYIKIDVGEKFPRIDITRRVADDGSRYFGPFASASSMRKTMALLKRLFPYRSCTKKITGHDPRPCLEYHIKRCVAPCVGYASEDEYREVIGQVVMFLEGKHVDVVRDLKRQMSDASDELKFERAASLRDQMKAIEKVAQDQKAVTVGTRDQDVIAVAQSDDEAWIEVFFIREGNLIGRDHFILAGARGEEPSAIIGEFANQYYPTVSHIPDEILVEYEPLDSGALIEALKSKGGRLVRLHRPLRGDKKRLLDLVARNAQEGLARRRVKWLTDTKKVSTALDELHEALSLPEAPNRIETYDISNTQGSNAVGSMVVFEDGRPNTALYRRFKIKAVEGSDDYAMMREVLIRRFNRLAQPSDLKIGQAGSGGIGQKDLKGWGAIPDLVLIDGGRGHLNAALEVMLQVGLAEVPLASIAKKDEQVYIPEMVEPISLARNSQALYLVQRMRDEAHRFAVTYHRNLRSKSSTRSLMDEVQGIGPRRKKALLRRFGSVQGVREADIEEIAAVPGMTRRLAERLKISL